MYKIKFLPSAKKDIDNIIYYVSNDLNNKSAAKKLSKSFIECANEILIFPYGEPIYGLSKKMNQEYRCIKIKNYCMFYVVNEKLKEVIVVRVLYKKMNINNILK